MKCWKQWLRIAFYSATIIQCLKLTAQETRPEVDSDFRDRVYKLAFLEPNATFPQIRAQWALSYNREAAQSKIYILDRYDHFEIVSYQADRYINGQIDNILRTSPELARSPEAMAKRISVRKVFLEVSVSEFASMKKFVKLSMPLAVSTNLILHGEGYEFDYFTASQRVRIALSGPESEALKPNSNPLMLWMTEVKAEVDQKASSKLSRK